MRHFFDPVDKVPLPEEDTENTQGKLNVFVQSKRENLILMEDRSAM